MTLAELETLLDAFGGAPGRWPEGRRSAALALIVAEPAAKRLHEEAQALDRLLGHASEPDGRRVDALLERLMQHPELSGDGTSGADHRTASERARRVAGNVVLLPGQRVETIAPSRGPAQKRGFFGPEWRIAAALVGALLTGVAAGTTDFVGTTTVDLVAEARVVRGDADVVLASLYSDPILGVIDEESQ